MLKRIVPLTNESRPLPPYCSIMCFLKQPPPLMYTAGSHKSLTLLLVLFGQPLKLLGAGFDRPKEFITQWRRVLVHPMKKLPQLDIHCRGDHFGLVKKTASLDIAVPRRVREIGRSDI